MARAHGEAEHPGRSAWERVWQLVRSVPQGTVVTYGDISRALAGTLSPVAVGWALHGCPEDVPWQRVVNASGRCSTERLPDLPPGLQRTLLEAEGVEFAEDDSIDLDRFRWHGLRAPGDLFDSVEQPVR